MDGVLNIAMPGRTESASLTGALFPLWALAISDRRRSSVLSMAISSSRALEALSSSCSRVSSAGLSSCFDLAIMQCTKRDRRSQHADALSKVRLRRCFSDYKRKWRRRLHGLSGRGRESARSVRRWQTDDFRHCNHHTGWSHWIRDHAVHRYRNGHGKRGGSQL